MHVAELVLTNAYASCFLVRALKLNKKQDIVLSTTAILKDNMEDPADIHDSSAEEDLHDGDGLFGYVGKVIPYFRKRSNVLLFKLDIMLLFWMFVAGVSELRDRHQ